MYGEFVKVELTYDKITIQIYSVKDEIEFIPNLKETLSRLKSYMELENLTIIQGVHTEIDSAACMIFYKGTLSLYKSIFRSYLCDKIKDRWIV